MNFLALFQNKVLIAGLIAWALAQVIKFPWITCALDDGTGPYFSRPAACPVPTPR